MERAEYIDNFFKGTLTKEERMRFEDEILKNPEFASEVAFYISARAAARDEVIEDKKQQFREMYEKGKVIPLRPKITLLWKCVAAAVVIVVVFSLVWFFNSNGTSPHRLADQYLEKNFVSLPVRMGKTDSLETGISLYNTGKLQEALPIFEGLANANNGSIDAVKFAGVVSLRLHLYNKAIRYFTRLGNTPDLYSNPGKFYQAIALLVRNEKGDAHAAKQLLQEVVDGNLQGKAEAEKWLSEF